jgi:hypothetical protein
MKVFVLGWHLPTNHMRTLYSQKKFYRVATHFNYVIIRGVTPLFFYATRILDGLYS